MGLRTTHNCWNAPYSSFNEFRRKLAKQIGIDLDDYIGYGENGFKDLSSIDHKIMPLLNHSDCDGILTPDECKLIHDGLRQILKGLHDDRDQFFIDEIITFKNGCLEAYQKGECVEFK